MQPPAGGPGGPALDLQQLANVLNLAQLAASLRAAQAAAAAPALLAPPPGGASDLYLGLGAAGLAPPPPALPPAASLPTPAAPPATSGTSSDRLRHQGDATIELEAPIAANANGVAGLKLPVTCNDIRGIVYLDQQVVACYCPACEQRVGGGHGRPLFSFTRFERHSGSKAKKWRLSIRIDPGAVKEAPIDEPPLALGQWLDSKGLVSWAPRGGLKIGPSGGGGSSDDEGSPTYGDEDGGRRFAAPPSAGPRQAPALGNLSRQASQGKRRRLEYETPDLPGQEERQQWLEAQRAAFDAVAAAAEAASTAAPAPQDGSGSAGGAECKAGEAGASGAGASGGASEGSNGRAGRSAHSAQHAAIFVLVYGLLDEGEDRRSFNEAYLPWLNDLPRERLDSEFTTLHSYLRLLGGGMPSETVRAQMTAYLRAVIAKAAAAR